MWPDLLVQRDMVCSLLQEPFHGRVGCSDSRIDWNGVFLVLPPAVHEIMSDTTDAPGSIPLNLGDFPQQLCDIFVVFLDYFLLLDWTWRQSVQVRTLKSEYVDDRPCVIQRGCEEDWHIYKWVQILCKHTSPYFVFIFFVTAGQRKIYLCIHKFGQDLQAISHQVVVRMVDFLTELVTIHGRISQYRDFTLGIVSNILRPLHGGNSPVQGSSQQYVCKLRKEAQAVVQVSECLHCVVVPSEINLVFFVEYCLGPIALETCPIARFDDDFGPVVGVWRLFLVVIEQTEQYVLVGWQVVR